MPTYKLYDQGSITWASVLGGPVAGCSLMALNYRRLGQTSSAWIALITGVAVTAAVIGAAQIFPAISSTSGLVLALATRSAAISLQTKQIDAHREAGGEFASRWQGFGMGLAVSGSRGWA